MVAIDPGTYAQQGRWADANDKTAQALIDFARQWAESPCTHQRIIETILADDFQGTRTDGTRYTKAQALEGRPRTGKIEVRDCRLDSARVRFFSSNMAVMYGSESRLRKVENQPEERRCQIWTDVWLKRKQSWKVIAAHDMRVDCK
jgi:hypothetical protein